MISVCFHGKPFNITVIQVYASTSNAEKAEAEWFYEDLQDLLELKPPKDVLFMIGDWNVKVGSQETPGVTGKFDRNKTSKILVHPSDRSSDFELALLAPGLFFFPTIKCFLLIFWFLLEWLYLIQTTWEFLQ